MGERFRKGTGPSLAGTTYRSVTTSLFNAEPSIDEPRENADVDRAAPNNWLDDTFWTKLAYLSFREPLPINSDWLAWFPYLSQCVTHVHVKRWVALKHDPDIPKSITDSRPPDGEFGDWQLRRAAHFVWRLGDFKSKLDRYVPRSLVSGSQYSPNRCAVPSQEILPESSRAGLFCMHQYTR
jgi:carnitine O-acetyltransferase